MIAIEVSRAIGGAVSVQRTCLLGRHFWYVSVLKDLNQLEEITCTRYLCLQEIQLSKCAVMWSILGVCCDQVIFWRGQDNFVTTSEGLDATSILRQNSHV